MPTAAVSNHTTGRFRLTFCRFGWSPAIFSLFRSPVSVQCGRAAELGPVETRRLAKPVFAAVFRDSVPLFTSAIVPVQYPPCLDESVQSHARLDTTEFA